MTSITMKKNSKIVINGVEYSGSCITVKNGSVIIDGNTLDEISEKEISISIHGDCDDVVAVSGEVNVSGRVGSVNTTSGDVTTQGDCGNISSVSGNITVKGGAKNASTVSGNIFRS